MTHEIEAQWMGKMQFNILVNGHTLILDAPERAGGDDNGPIPKPLILSALAGCSGMDIANLLKRSGNTMDDLEIKVTGELTKQAPIAYNAIHLVYKFKGPLANMDAALNAVLTSQEQLCGVSSMLKKIMPVSWDVFYNGKQVYTTLIQLPHLN